MNTPIQLRSPGYRTAFTGMAIAAISGLALTGCSSDSDSNDVPSTTVANSSSAAGTSQSSTSATQKKTESESIPTMPSTTAAGSDNPLLLSLVGGNKNNTDVKDVMGANTTETLGPPALSSGMPYYAPGVQFTRGGTTLVVCARGSGQGLEQVAAVNGTSCDFALQVASAAKDKLDGSKTLSDITPMDVTAQSPVTDETLTLRCESQSQVTACQSTSGASVVMW